MNNSSPSLSCILREAKEERISGQLYDGFGFCAAGILAKALGWQPVDMHTDFVADMKGYDILAEKIGHELVTKVWQMNDSGKSWNEIADMLEDMGY